MGGCMMLYISCMRGESWSTLFHIPSPCFNGKTILFTMSLCSGQLFTTNRPPKIMRKSCFFPKSMVVQPFGTLAEGKLLVLLVRGAATAFFTANDLMVIDTLQHRSGRILRWHDDIRKLGSMLRVSPFLHGVYWLFRGLFLLAFHHHSVIKNSLVTWGHLLARNAIH